ncbi:nitroreductase family protein [Paenibacillus agricola]|uniref:Putative NAD(P)H nitroreductase n=1 Tax=Paenibacillus agricola TaxID=2716264 RepID=A0ABX0J6G9_9BACL|nr:nitroreductase [Paenibacillus agricola]NHN29679.1 nitroreductase [Paenibacillus agricola]
MQLTQLLKERRSVHRFQDREVPIELVTELLDTAVWVPNHKMTQPWRFVIVHGEGRKRIAEISRTAVGKRERDPEKSKELGQKFHDKFMAVPMFVVVLMKESPAITVREEDYASTSCLIHNFSLLAWEQGIGLVWESYPLLSDNAFRTALGIQPGERAIGSLHVGYPEQIPAAQPRIPAAELITIIEST